MKHTFAIEPLNAAHDKEVFDCGEESLNQFLQKYAGQNARKGFGRTFVAVLPSETIVRGFYTLSASSVEFENFQEKLPRYPIPTAHLGRLGVDQSMQGQGLGALLLIDALSRTNRAADELGIYAVELFALTENARSFYQKFGFEELLDDPLHLYLPMKTIRQLLEK